MKNKDKKVIDFEKTKRKINIKKLLRALRIPIVAVAVIIAIFLSARLIGNVATSNATDAIRQIKSVFSSGGGFPYSLESREVKKIDSIGNRMLILCSDESLVLDRKAGEQFSYQLGNAESKAITSNGRALVYSNGSNKVILQSKTEQLGTVEEEGAVVTASLSKKGNFATSHMDKNGKSILTVYNRKLEKEFVWSCADERITAISLSDDGKRVAVAAIGVENAEIYSRVLLFDTSESEAVYDMKLSGTLFLRVYCSTKNSVIAVGDNRTVVFGKDGGAVDELTYAENSISNVESDDKGNVAVCVSEFGGSRTSVTVFKKNGKRACAFSIDGEPSDVDIGSGKVAAAVGGEIIVFNFKGVEKKRIQTDNSPSQVFIVSGDFYTVESGAICKY